MKLFINNIVEQLINYSSTLNDTSILIDKPWALLDDELEVQKLIFKKNKELILSKNGQVQIGKWDYFPNAKSLLIDRNADIILCKEVFIDKGVMILSKEGIDSRFFIFANENILPDFDAKSYLNELRYQKLRIIEQLLHDGRILEVYKSEILSDPFDETFIGGNVSIEASPIADGKYQLAEMKKYYEVKDGTIHKIITETTYTNPDKHEILILQQHNLKIKNGDELFMFGEMIENAIINFSKSKNIIVRDGKVVRLERKNPLTKWLSRIFGQFFGTYYK